MEADVLGKLASIAEGIPEEVTLQVRKHRGTEVAEVLAMERRPPVDSWMTPFTLYIQKEILPEDPREAKRVKRRAASFFFKEGQLYKRSFGRPALKWLNLEKGLELINEVHDGVCGNHKGERAVMHKILRMGYEDGENGQYTRRVARTRPSQGRPVY